MAAMIRPVTPDLIPALSRLACDCFTETFGHLYPPEDLEVFLAKSYAADKLAAEIADPAQYWRVVMADDQPVAYLQIGPVNLPHDEADPASHGEIKKLYVHSSYQGRRLGQTLLSHAIDYLAQAYGASPQWLGVWNGNTKAQALYAKHGFEKVGGYIFPVGKTMDDEFILRRIP